MTLAPNHTEQLRKSAINDAIIAERGYSSIFTSSELAKQDGQLADYQRRLPAMGVPLYRLGNKQPHTLIIRPDTPRIHKRENGSERQVKYEYPAGATLCIDILPRFADKLSDVTVPIWFTEGAKKADALASLEPSIVPANVNGVWCWRSKRDEDGERFEDGKGRPLADFEHIALKGRRVVLAWDSDWVEKKEVRQALEAFKTFLTKCGAHVGILTLPHGDDKLGVDDAIAAGWTFEQLLTVVDDGRPRIVVRDLDIPTIAGAAWAALLKQPALPLYRRDGVLYELAHDDEQSPLLIEMSKPRLRGYLARAAQFVEQRKKRGETMEWVVEPPSSILDDMLIRIHADIPLITRITRCPFVTEDGAIVATPGYHASSRIFYEPLPGVTIPAIAEQPTEADMIAARTLILDELLGDFKFVDQADKAHAVALLLLPYIRDAIRGPTPLHLVEAPGPGSGKTLLADVALLPAFGVTPTPITEAGDDDEWRKRITSVLSSTPAAVYIDNINRTLAGGAISAALTATTWSDRLLGTNKTMSAPVRCVWVATANNPTLSGEVARRCIRIRIDPQIDRPWKRTGFKHADLRQWTLEQQGAIVGAALTLIRYGFQSSEGAATSLGSFEAWSKVMGRILAAAGIPAFLGNLDELYDRADTEGAAWRTLIAAWVEKHKTATVTGAEVFEVYKAGDYDLSLNGKDEKAQRVAFGKRLKKQQDRIIGGYQVTNKGTGAGRAQLWQLRAAQPASEGREDSEGFDPYSMHIRVENTDIQPCDTCDTCDAPVHVETMGLETFTTFTTFTNILAPVDTPLPPGPLTTAAGLDYARKEYRLGGAKKLFAWLTRTNPTKNLDAVIAQVLAAEQAELASA